MGLFSCQLVCVVYVNLFSYFNLVFCVNNDGVWVCVCDAPSGMHVAVGEHQ